MHIAVIGGGPGGAVAAAFLARSGHAVELYEAQAFPRFHVGESLLPCSLPILEACGIDRTWWQAQGFQRKHGATFELPDGSAAARFDFGKALPGDPDHAWQVERAVFDHALLEHARTQGVTIHQPCVVDAVELAGERPELLVDGQRRAVDFVVDASGREALIGRGQALRDTEGDLKRGAVYGHVPGLDLPPAAAPGDVCIVMTPDGWAWQIPLVCGRVSVGLVLEREALRHGGGPEGVFRANLARFPALAERLAGRGADPVRSTPNISYRVRQRHGRRWALVGDSGGFIDPIFSSGIHLALAQGQRLAAVLDRAGPDADLSAWEAAAAHDLAVFTAFIRLWYQHRTLRTLMFAPSQADDIARGITSVLAGNTSNPDNAFLGMLLKRAARVG
jgi:flavin-dependent dehydrogenase